MRTIRQNVFETNSSSEHTLVLSPVENGKSLQKEIKAIKKHLSENIKDGMYVIDPDRIWNLDFGEFKTFEDKFLFVFVLLLLSGECSKKLMTQRMWENECFTISKANKVFPETNKDFVKKICKWMEDMSGVECRGIKIGDRFNASGKKLKRCHWDINHQSLYDAQSEENLGLKEDIFTVVTTIGMTISYEFC